MFGLMNTSQGLVRRKSLFYPISRVSVLVDVHELHITSKVYLRAQRLQVGQNQPLTRTPILLGLTGLDYPSWHILSLADLWRQLLPDLTSYLRQQRQSLKLLGHFPLPA